MPRKYLPTLADLIDRLSIVQLKEVLGDGKHRTAHALEIRLILGDLTDMLPAMSADLIRAIVVLAEMNAYIWHCEQMASLTQGPEWLAKTRRLNGVRIRAKNRIEAFGDDRKDHKIDCISAEIPEWEPSW